MCSYDYNFWPTLTFSPDLTLNWKSLGASYIKTIVDPKLNSPKISPFPTMLQFHFCFRQKPFFKLQLVPKILSSGSTLINIEPTLVAPTAVYEKKFEFDGSECGLDIYEVIFYEVIIKTWPSVIARYWWLWYHIIRNILIIAVFWFKMDLN